MQTQALLIADDPGYQGWLDKCLSGEVSILPADGDTQDALVEEVRTTPDVAVVFVEFGGLQLDRRTRLVEALTTQFPEVAIVAVGGNEESNAVLSAMRAGASDYFVINRDDDNLVALVNRVLRRSRATETAAQAPDDRGNLYAVIASQQNASIPFIAMHMALAMQEGGDESRRILLLDLSLPGGASLVFLNTEQQYSALEALGDAQRLDQTLIDTAFTHYRDNFHVLSWAESTVGPPSVDHADFVRLLDKCRHFFDVVVVAADSGMFISGLATLLDNATRSILITDQSVLKSRQNRHLLHALRGADCQLDSLRLVIDSYLPNVGLDPDRLASLLGIEFLASLSGRNQARIQAMNAGENMFEFAPRNSFPREIRSLVEQLTGDRLAAPEADQGGLLERLFGK